MKIIETEIIRCNDCNNIFIVDKDDNSKICLQCKTNNFEKVKRK